MSFLFEYFRIIFVYPSIHFFQELFIDSLAKEAYKYTVQTKKKTVQKRDIENAINNVDALVFLEEMLE